MSNAYRELEEYIELYAKTHKMTVQEVVNVAVARLFKEYKEHENDEFNLETENSIKS